MTQSTEWYSSSTITYRIDNSFFFFYEVVVLLDREIIICPDSLGKQSIMKIKQFTMEQFLSLSRTMRFMVESLCLIQIKETHVL